MSTSIGGSLLVRHPTVVASDYRASVLAIWSALAAVYLIWGSTYLAIRYALETMPPFLMAATRFIVSGGFLYLLRRTLGDPRPKPVEWRNAAIIGIFLLVGGNGGVVWAEQFVTSSFAALMVATVPVWIVLIDGLRPSYQRPNFFAILGILIGFSGVVVLVGSAARSADTMNLVGSAALIFSSCSWAIGSLYGRSAKLCSSQLLVTAMEMLAGGIALLLLAFVTGEWSGFDFAAISTRSGLALIYLTVIGSGAFVAYVWLLRVAPTPLVATYAYVNPLVAVLLGYLLADEPITLRTLAAGALIVGSVALVSVPKRQQSTDKKMADTTRRAARMWRRSVHSHR
jgi:drug/metabolite transporter (DMT)-like permease